MYTGPKLTNDGLVFGYDTGYGIADNTIPTRFYPGKSTTNLLTNSGAQDLDVRSDIYYNVTKTDLGNGKFKFVNDGTGGTTIRLYCNVNDLTNGATYGCSVSYEQFDPGDGNSLTIDWCDQGNDGFAYSTYGSANRIHMSASRWTYDSTFRFMDISLPTNASIVLFDAQVEAGESSPFVNGTRANTDSLIDLTKSTDLTLSAITYDSTGQPDYDGTDDYINLGNYAPIRLGTNFTIECVVRPEEDKWMYHFWKGYGSNNSLALGRHSSNGKWMFASMVGGSYVYLYTGTATVNKYCHLVYTYDGSNVRIYENGILQTTSAQTHDMLTSSASAGIGGPNRHWNGKIPVTKIYSKVLTTEEVVSNFKAYKNRFDI